MHVLAVVVARSDAPRDHTLEYHRYVRLVPLGDVTDLPAFQSDLLPQVAGGEPRADELAEVRHDCLWLGVPPEAQLNPHSLSRHAHNLTYSVGIDHDLSGSAPSWRVARRSVYPLYRRVEIQAVDDAHHLAVAGDHYARDAVVNHLMRYHQFALADLNLGDVASHHLPHRPVGRVGQVVHPVISSLGHEREVLHELHVPG